MGLSVTEARKWHENGESILKFKESLDNRFAGRYYSADFDDIYYGCSRDKSFAEITEACNKLAKGVLHLSLNEQKEIVRDFVSISLLASKDSIELQSFWALLKSHGWLPVDPEVVERKRAEEAARLRRQKEEERRAREAREREEIERKRVEEAARLRRQKEEKERRSRKAREALNRRLSITDAKKWHENGMSILGFKGKLDNKAAGKKYSADFDDIYYGYSRSKSFGEITEACNKLAKGVLNLSSNEQKGIVRDFVSTSKLASKDSKELQSFWDLLKSHGWLPVDPEVERKRAEEAARLRRQREQEEQRIRWAREAREREKSEWIFDLVRGIALLIGVVVVVWLVIFAVKKGISSYKYYYTEYEVLIEKSEELSGQYKYTEALEALQDAKARKSNKKKIQEVERRIATVLAERDEKCATLRLEIAKVWDSYFVKNKGRVSNTLNKSIVKYVQRSDIQPLVESTLSKIELLKTISSDTKEYEVNMTKIKILKTYYKL